MSGRHLTASLACLLAVGLLGLAPASNAASAGQSSLKSGESAKKKSAKKKSARKRAAGFKRRGRGPQRIYLPMGPASIYYDYPYYYSRGYYPTHIGGYVYYPYAHSRMRYGRYGGPLRLKPRRN
jgi:hypothetical protein